MFTTLEIVLFLLLLIVTGLLFYTNRVSYIYTRPPTLNIATNFISKLIKFVYYYFVVSGFMFASIALAGLLLLTIALAGLGAFAGYSFYILTK